MEDDVKVCHSCGVGYPRDTVHFSRMRACKDGLCPYCKKCKAEKERVRKKACMEKHQKTAIEQSALRKTCAACHTEKSGLEFTINRTMASGLNSYCRACQKVARLKSAQKRGKRDASATAPKTPIFKKKRCQRCGLVKPTEEFGDARKVCGSCENAASLIVSGLIGAETGDAERRRRDELAALMFARWNEVSGMK
ncbi:hypothetical protein [Medusavirus stheno T3]|uniref:Uncharacterized protein n=1 Tax=Medusavirus stheno T3 TaxID=3069717 RepID=A0A7S7YEY9_9VIRU|nr:hypothetical protein QKU73_gp207 [Acanthamoeba castellanii medusavirus]QPB44568.1 hypothetical protein [Medusavirus stheno T3]